MILKLTSAITLALICTTSFASTLVNSYSDARSALMSGNKMTIVFNEKNCANSSYPVQASLTPHSVILTSSSIVTGDTAVTQDDPLAQGQLVRELMNYTFLPNNGKLKSYTCTNADGCMLLNAAVYRVSDGQKITTYPTISCQIGKTVNLYFR